MDVGSSNKKQRQYFIDWLRIGLIISVFFFHVGMIFRPEPWHVNSLESFPFLDPIMWWLHLWRMPLLFLVSGVGTYYAIGHRSARQYVRERFTRLFVPFAIGFFTLVPIQVYIERIELYPSFLEYLPHMFDGGPYPDGNLSWHHLWFILYLFVISLLITPFLQYARSGHYRLMRTRLVRIASQKMGLNWLLPIILFSQIILRHYFPNNTHALLNDWAYFTYYLLFFISGFVLFTNNQIIAALVRDRRLYLYQAVIFTILLFSLDAAFQGSSTVVNYANGITGIVISWSCALTALGYFRRYFNRDNVYRRILNEAIYPFYLLHQPAIILTAYFVLQWKIPFWVQAVLIILISLALIVLVYWFAVRRANVLRIAFGLKRKPDKSHQTLTPLSKATSLSK